MKHIDIPEDKRICKYCRYCECNKETTGLSLCNLLSLCNFDICSFVYAKDTSVFGLSMIQISGGINYGNYCDRHA